MTPPRPLGATAARVVAQAKVNLGLHVLAREASGYHQLETLFQRVELGDDVTVRTGGAGDSLDCRGADAGPLERNLAWRAAHAFRARTGWPRAFAIEIDKRVPVGGGLGGGSADAGAVLRCLNALAPVPLAAADLIALASPLGSDVPFLTAEAPLALAWGRGERMLALPALPPRRAALWLFDEGVATADAFRWLAEARASDPVGAPAPRLWGLADVASWRAVAQWAGNDFEAVVFRRRPDVQALFEALAAALPASDAAGGEPGIVRMTGSGATIVHLPAGVQAGATVRHPGRLVETETATRVAAVTVAD